ncbi:MAG: co-chaperone GroES [Candidatus Woesearchaeota archaeon]
MNVKPLGNRVIIEPKKQEEKTKGGIYLPETAQDKKNTGKVVAISDSIKECPFSVGDTVMFEKFSAKEISDADSEYVIVDYKDVLAKLD